MRLQMVIDATLCMNCKACILACQQRNAVPSGLSRNWVRPARVPEGVNGRARAEIQEVQTDPVTGTGNTAAAPSTPAVLTSLSGKHFQPGNCMQCRDAPCVRACPTGATYIDTGGVVLVNADKCISCGACMEACPYGARFRNPVTRVIDKCDYCAASRAQGLEPACVTVCPVKARLFGDADDPDSAVSLALKRAGTNVSFVESGETPTQPAVTYLGQTTPRDWPHGTHVPPPLAAMRPVAKAVTWLGGAALFGVIAVGLRQLLPDVREERRHEEKGKKGDL